MLEIFKEAYYYLDLLIGFCAPFLIYFLYKTGRIEKFVWHCFWLGVLVGLTWEIPIFVLSGESTSIPIVTWIRPLITHYLVFMIAHSLWDGLLFVIGIWLVYRICRQPFFQKFRWSEVLVFLIWGQVSELLVELSSTLNDGWVFLEYWWNPVIFHCNGHNITWLMQIIWGAASIGYYLLLIKLKSKDN
ncbi:hypothetical protein ACFL27_02100 [candidate division CSSED10-310 bacterium]|uniref:DUF1405 domain-containing protein n=1 Tax=candidate division CSSED10-310 bacterium TaxID=2855610 RepID=A0ABV6YS01_UNCC1